MSVLPDRLRLDFHGYKHAVDGRVPDDVGDSGDGEAGRELLDAVHRSLHCFRRHGDDDEVLRSQDGLLHRQAGSQGRAGDHAEVLRVDNVRVLLGFETQLNI